MIWGFFMKIKLWTIKSVSVRTIFMLAFISIGIIVFLTYQNNALSITNYNYKNPKLPRGFHGYRIVQVSDLHNKNYHGRLIGKIKKVNPHIIVITGDLIDRRNTKIDTALNFVQQAAEIAPIYYVSGNHEQLSGKYDEFKNKLRKQNARGGLQKFDVQIMDNYYIILKQNGDEIGLMGIADPTTEQNRRTYFRHSSSRRNSSRYAEDNLRKLFNYNHINTDFNILLSHRQEPFSV